MTNACRGRNESTLIATATDQDSISYTSLPKYDIKLTRRPQLLKDNQQARSPTNLESQSGMKELDRITLDPEVMGGRACIRGMRVTVGNVVGLLASGLSATEILEAYPHLELEDIEQSLAYAAWRLE